MLSCGGNAQVFHVDTTEVTLIGDQQYGFGFTLDFPPSSYHVSSVFFEPPIITYIEPNSPAERFVIAFIISVTS